MNRRTQEPARPMYIYDRVCHRESKRREILHEYGTAPARLLDKEIYLLDMSYLLGPEYE